MFAKRKVIFILTILSALFFTVSGNAPRTYAQTCSYCSHFEGPADGATLTIGTTQLLEGWAYFGYGPAGTGISRWVDMYISNRGSLPGGSGWKYIGQAHAPVTRGDTIGANWCGGGVPVPAPGNTGWNLNWTVGRMQDGTYVPAGNYDLWVAPVNSAAAVNGCVGWKSKPVTLIGSPPPPTHTSAPPPPTDTPATPTPIGTVNCDSYTPSWNISSITPNYTGGKVGFTIAGNFPHMRECGRNLWSLVYARESYGAAEKSYYRSQSTEITSWSDTQVVVAPIYSYTDGDWTFLLIFCEGFQTDGQCTLPFNNRMSRVTIMNSIPPTLTPTPSPTTIPPYCKGGYRWAFGAAGQSCDAVCSGIGGTCSSGSWNDDTSCTVMKNFTTCTSCTLGDFAVSPYRATSAYECFYRGSAQVSCGDWTTWNRRLCACVSPACPTLTPIPPTSTPIPPTSTPIPPSDTPSPICPDGELGNINCDTQGLIDETDLTILLNKWWTGSGAVPTPGSGHRSADLNDNGTVDETDLTRLLNNWYTG